MSLPRLTVNPVRQHFVEDLLAQRFSIDKSGCKTLEISPADFCAVEPLIFGDVNHDYVSREIAWYETTSLNVNDIPGGAPEIWRRVADKDGFINSNYGWCLFHPDNFNQYERARDELKKNPDSRRACMIVIRPSIWNEYDFNGRSDFMCTWGYTWRLRSGRLDLIVNMRSNDVVFGYRNDRAWAAYVQRKLAAELGAEVGTIFWHCDSLHVYERHFYLVDHYARAGQTSITKRAYREAYPDSPWIEAMEK